MATATTTLNLGPGDPMPAVSVHLWDTDGDQPHTHAAITFAIAGAAVILSAPASDLELMLVEARRVLIAHWVQPEPVLCPSCGMPATADLCTAGAGE